MARPSTHVRVSRDAWRRTGLVAALVATLALVGCMPATASDVRVRHAFFGVHDGTATSSSFGQIHEGAVRLWDVGVQWGDIETSKGHYDWTRLDQLVSAAQQAHAEVTMVVAMTPHFYSNVPTNVPVKKIPAYKAFVKALMKRYKNFHGKRGIAAYEVWNEANIATFWTGTVKQMAALTKAMYDVRNKVDKRAKVIGPAMVTRLGYQLEGLSKYYGSRAGGKAVWRYLDAVGLSLYPLPKYGKRTGVPEDGINQLNQVKRILHQRGVPASKAIWNTEVNYGLQTGDKAGSPAAPVSDARQASNVMRTYLLNAANGVKRVFWYRYDWTSTMSNTILTKRSDVSQLTAAGAAYARAQKWMHGTLLGAGHHRPCQKDRHGTYTCVVKDSSGKRYIYWNPFHTAKVRLPKGVHYAQGVLGATTSVKPHSTLKVAYKPVMIYH